MKKSQEQKMLFCNCMCAWHPVRVVHGVSGHIRSLSRPITVGELLRTHPHHFVCEPTATGPLFHTGMLPLDMELEEGRIYLLLPLPRLLPHLSSSSSSGSGSSSSSSFLNPNPPSCPCFTASQNTGPSPKIDNGIDNYSQSHAQCDLGLVDGRFLVRMRTWRKRVVQSRLVRSLVCVGRRMIPERLLLFRFSLWRSVQEDGNGDLGLKYSSGSKSVGVGTSSAVHSFSCSGRNRWRPGLECISEVDLLTGLLNPNNNYAQGE